MKQSKGFTLIELLIVVAISAMLTTITLVYTKASQNQIALTVETSKIAQTIIRAKDLALAAYISSPQVCAYGVSFDLANNKYSIFSFKPSPAKYGGPIPPCPLAASTTQAGINGGEIIAYSQGTFNVSLASGVKFTTPAAADSARVILFYPPAPTTLISRDGTNFMSPAVISKVYLSTSDGSSNTSISVNSQGQISF